MNHPHDDQHFSDELRHVADVLREGRPTLDPLALDRVKLRAMSAARRSSSSRPKGFLMKQRLTTLIAAGLLTLGTGGTLALAGGGDGGGGGGSASFHQYKPPCDKGKGKGGDHECHGHEGEEGGKGGDQGGGSGKGGGQGGGSGKGGDQGGQGHSGKGDGPHGPHSPHGH